MALKNIFKLNKKKEQTTRAPVNDSANGIVTQESIPSDSDSPTGTFNSATKQTAPTSTSTSLTSSNSVITNSNSNIYTQYHSLNNNANVPKELVPIVTLINCQNARVYHKGQLYLNIEKNDGALEQDLSYQLVDGLVKGNQVILYKEGLESTFKPISVNLLEASVKVIASENSIILSSSNKLAYHLKFPELRFLQQWLSCIKLSNFEFTKLNESYTASLLSSKATLLSDLHVLMAETRFQNEEWCNIKFSKNSNWIKCFCVISPCDKKRKGQYKTGSIQFYTSSKASKKHLICSINTVDSCFAVYPNHVDLIDDSTLLKLNGDVTVYNLGMQIDDLETPSSPVSRANSIKSQSPGPNSRSRSNSNARGNHLRSTSISSIGSSKSIKGWNINNTSLYILPRPHNAVKNFETLIRYLIPLYDSFLLYGRPKRLVAEKFDSSSLLFGLPSLPHTEYLTSELAYNLVNLDWSNILSLGENYNFNILFANKLKEFYNKNSNFKGFGDLKNSLINEVNFEDPMVKFNNYSIPDFDNDPSTPKYAFSISDLPANAKNEGATGTFNDGLRVPSASNLGALSNSPNSTNYGGNVPILKSPRLRSASNQFGSPLGAGSYTNLKSLASPISTNNISSELPSPDPSSPNINTPPTAVTAHQSVFKKNRDSVSVVA